jgi:hypothetical protein
MEGSRNTVGEHLCDVVPGPPTGRVWQPPWKGIAAGEKRALPGAVSLPYSASHRC